MTTWPPAPEVFPPLEPLELDDPPAPADTDIVRLVTIDGSLVRELPLATWESITWTPNAPDEAIVNFPKYGYSREEVHVLADDSGDGDLHEIQIIDPADPDHPKFWGPAVSADAASGDGKVALHCRGADWYLWRRFIDGQRDNLLANPSFENGTVDWAKTTGVTWAPSTAHAIRGANGLDLVSTGALTDQYADQTVTVVGTGIGTLVTIAGYFLIPTTLDGHSLDRRGLYVEGREGGDFKALNYYPIDEATPLGHWIRASTTIAVPPGATWDLNIRLYSPPGHIVWDDLEVVAMQSVSTASITGDITTPVDVAAIVGLINAHVQNSDVGKSHVNITLDNPDTGVTMVKHIQWADHVPWPTQMAEWIDRDDCLDYSMVYTATDRVLTLHSPRQGVDRRADVTLHFPGNVAKHTLTEDGGSTTTADTELSQDTGNGPDREEGHYADTSAVGVTLEAVNSAKSGVAPSSLDPAAREVVNKAKRPALTFTLTVTDPDLMALLGLGDAVYVDIDDGWASTPDGAFAHISKLVEYARPPRLEVTLTIASSA